MVATIRVRGLEGGGIVGERLVVIALEGVIVGDGAVGRRLLGIEV